MKNTRLLEGIILASVFLVTLVLPGAARGDAAAREDFFKNLSQIGTIVRGSAGSSTEDFFRNLHKSVALVAGEDELFGQVKASRRPIGTAFVVTKNGLAMTNAHVVSGMKNFKLFFIKDEKMEMRSAQLILSDSYFDVAVLKILSENNETFDFLSFGDPEELVAGYSDISIAGYSPSLGGKGKKLFIGNGKVTQGKVLGDSGGMELGLYIATNISGGKGNSGSPCLHKNKVVGIAAAIKISNSSDAIGPLLCISANLAKQVLGEAIDGGSIIHGLMNIDLTQLPPNLIMAVDQYAYPFPEEPPLVAVVNGHYSGLRPLDRIISLKIQKEGKENTVPIVSIVDFRRAIGNLSPGTFITATIIRAGEKMEITLSVEPIVQENIQQH